MIHFPDYNIDGIQDADKDIVDELRTQLELKHGFLNKDSNSSLPNVTLLLTEIQGQQSLMKMYQIIIKKIEGQLEAKEIKISSLRKNHEETIFIK